MSGIQERARQRAKKMLPPQESLEGLGHPSTVAEPPKGDDIVDSAKGATARNMAFHLAAFASMLLLWQAGSMFFEETILPGPVPVIKAMVENLTHATTYGDIGATVGRVVVGMLFAILGGLVLGLVMGLSRKAEQYFDAWVMVGLTIPAVVYGIVGILWFGLNSTSAIVAIALTCLPTVALNMWQGTKAIDTSLIHMGKAFRLSPWRIARSVVIPQVVPYLLAAFRYALGIAWKTATIVELIGLNKGVGYQLAYWFGLYNMREVLAWTLTFTLVLLIFEFLVFKPAELYLTRWRPNVQDA